MKHSTKRAARYNDGGVSFTDDTDAARRMLDAPGGGGGAAWPARSVGRDIARAVEEAKKIAPGAENIRYRDKMLGYTMPIGKDQSITPYVGKGRVGVTYTVGGLKKGGKVSASSRADGIAKRGKTRGKMV